MTLLFLFMKEKQIFRWNGAGDDIVSSEYLSMKPEYMYVDGEKRSIFVIFLDRWRCETENTWWTGWVYSILDHEDLVFWKKEGIYKKVWTYQIEEIEKLVLNLGELNSSTMTECNQMAGEKINPLSVGKSWGRGKPLLVVFWEEDIGKRKDVLGSLIYVQRKLIFTGGCFYLQICRGYLRPGSGVRSWNTVKSN